MAMWRLMKQTNHSDFKIASTLYQHEIGARLLHLHAEDNNKAFAVMFRTSPRDDKGTPHVLEHTALCGSQKYPIRDPFFHMLKRSLNSYMNAWTGSDFTMYPFSTQNEQDFKNLLSVYLDSAFFPNLSEYDFRQEGIRTEMVNGELQFKGVVYNEMKGMVVDPEYTFLLNLQKNLFPGTAYANDSGGDPVAIPTLTHDDLVRFHADHYHPANSTFFFYGDQEIEPYLDYIHENVITQFSPSDADTTIGDVHRFDQPLELKLKVPPEAAAIDPSRTHKFALSWLCNETSSSPYETFCLQVLGHILLNSDKAPMYKSLIESGIGIQYCPGTGYDTSTREASFIIGVNGIREDQGPEVEKTILKTLHECMSSGFDSRLINSAIHQIEIQHKEVKENFGLAVISTMIPYALHGEDPVVPLYINDYVRQLQKELDKGVPVFQDLIRRHLWDNQHKLSMSVAPDPLFLSQKGDIEAQQLKALDERLSQSDKNALVTAAHDLAERQSELQDGNILPTLAISDINSIEPDVPFKHVSSVSGVPFQTIEQATNGITYLRLKVNTKDLPLELRPLLPLYVHLINRIGTEKYSYEDFDNVKELYTLNGISASQHSASRPDTLDDYDESIVLSIGFLDKNTGNAVDLLTNWFTSAVFNEQKHITTTIQKHVMERNEQLVTMGHRYAIDLASSSLSAAANTYEPLSTLQHDFDLITQLIKSISSDAIVQDLETRLKAIHSFVQGKERHDICVHISDSDGAVDELKDRLELMYSALELEQKPQFLSVPTETYNKFIYQVYFTLPMQVNFAAEAFHTVPFAHADYGKLTVLSELLSLNYLHKEIREKEGAYGAGAQNDPHKGTMTLFSYRDPNNIKTYSIYEKCIDQIINKTFSEQDLDESKLSAFQKIDKPIAPNSKGLNSWLYGVNQEQRQTYREGVLAATAEQIIDAAKRYLAEPLAEGKTSRVVFGSETVDVQSLKKLGWRVQKPIDEQTS